MRLRVHIQLLLGFILAIQVCQGEEPVFAKRTWIEGMLKAREVISAARSRPDGEDHFKAAARTWLEMREHFPVEWDWVLQDGGHEFPTWFHATGPEAIQREMLRRAIVGLGPDGAAFQARAARLSDTGDMRKWLELYAEVCGQRRERRLATVLVQAPRIVFTKHRTIRPSFFAYTEGQSDAQHERHFLPGAELCLLEMKGSRGEVRTLVADPKGAIRDPAVSWDGQRVVFAWKKSLGQDDYHLYELDMTSGKTRQLTYGLGFADYEPAFLPNGDLIFSSTRCVQTVDCFWTEASNLYTCDAEGRYLRRMSFDQVHAVYPQVLEDGRVIYTRWDYNDRGQIFPQPLFQMNSDGTGQTEFYGNNSWFPTTIAHARGIPGTQKVLAMLCGHHSSQAGKLAVIDPARGRQENSGVQLVAPIRPTPAERIDAYGQEGELWQYPYPLNERECLVTYAPLGWERGDAAFGIYWMDFDGNRELLVADSRVPCNQPVPLMARVRPPSRQSQVNHARNDGVYYLQDIYAGPGLAGVPRGTIKKLRVVALDFRPAGIGNNGSAGPGGGALISTPVSTGNGAWDVKRVLGEAEVFPDGSALFSVPARTPVYFQALDEKGHAVQTMRSWSTLQPGETFGCIGCHEPKNSAPTPGNYGARLAMKAGVQSLKPVDGQVRGFSFRKEIQPILDQHCIRCHKDRAPVEELVAGNLPAVLRKGAYRERAAVHGQTNMMAFSLLGTETEDATSKRRWSDAYLILTQSRPDGPEALQGAFRGDCEGRLVRWIGSQSVPESLPPYFSGASRSYLMKLLEQGHAEVRLAPEELQKIACWIDLLVPYCGDYLEAHAWTEEELGKYERYAAKRQQMELLERGNIEAMLLQNQNHSSDTQ